MQLGKIRIITSLSELEGLAKFWRAEQGHPAMDFDFFKVVISNRDNVEGPCVIVSEKGASIVGLLVGRIEKVSYAVRLGYIRLAAIPVRRLVLMSGGCLTKDPDVALELFASVGPLLKSFELDMAFVENLRRDGTSHNVLDSLYSKLWFSPASDYQEHWVMRLPDTWDDFLKSRSKKHRYWIKRLSTVLDREFAGRWQIKKYVSEESVSEFVEAADQVARKTYQRGLGAGFKLSAENFDRVKLEARCEQLRGYVLAVDGLPKAFWYCSVYRKTVYMAATGYDPAFRDYELGTVLLMRVFQDHCGAGLEWVDFGLGDAGYKQRFGTDHFLEASFMLFPHTLRGVCFSMLGRLTNRVDEFAKWTLNRLKLTQFIKTRWRRRIEQGVQEQAAL